MRNFSDVDIEPDIDFVMINTWRPCEIESSLISSKTCELRKIRYTESGNLRYLWPFLRWIILFLDGCYCRILLYSSVIPFPSEKNDPSNDSRKSVNARYHGN